MRDLFAHFFGTRIGTSSAVLFRRGAKNATQGKPVEVTSSEEVRAIMIEAATIKTSTTKVELSTISSRSDD